MRTKRITVAIGGIILILVLAGINYLFTNRDKEPAQDPSSLSEINIESVSAPQYEAEQKNDNFFEAFAAEKQATRDRECEYIDSIIENPATDEKTMQQAQAQKLELARCMELETIVKGLLQAKGYNDAAITVQKGSVNIIIGMQELASSDIAKILDIAKRETKEKAENIKIMSN